MSDILSHFIWSNPEHDDDAPQLTKTVDKKKTLDGFSFEIENTLGY